MLGAETNPLVFVSSFTAEHGQLRRDLFEMGRDNGRYVWVCEHEGCRPDLSGKEPLEICDTLMDRVRESQCYVIILGGSRRGASEHGTAVAWNGRPTATSHFEIELFQAALLGKPVELFIAEDFSPGPRLRSLLEILEFALPASSWRAPMRDAEIRREFGRLLRSPELTRSGFPRWGRHRLRSSLVSGLYRSRGGEGRAALRFLGGEFEERASRPDPELIAELLEAAAAASDQERKLGRLWIALRELMPARPEEARFQEYLPLWNRALGAWGAAAAWYGLHAHLHLGGLAALRSLSEVRARLRERAPAALPPAAISHPGPALASALYSIAKLTADGRERRELLDQALGELAPDSAPDRRQRSNVLALRGSIHLRRRRIASAVADYEEALRLREADGEDPARIGEAMSELGFGYLWQGRVRKGRDLMRRGVDLFGGGESGFAIRARKKLAVGYLLTGHWRQARRERETAAQMAKKHHAFDQL